MRDLARDIHSNRDAPAALLVFLLVGSLAIVSGCSAPERSPELGDLYSRAAQEGEHDRNPVIVIPGILGSKLVTRGAERPVWGVFGGDYADPGTPEGARLLALPMGEGRALHELTDEVVEAGALDRVKVDLLGLGIEAQAYLQILRSLGVGGYRDRDLFDTRDVNWGEVHFTCFQFAYDWRRDIAENAARLHAFIRAAAVEVRAKRLALFGDDRPVRFDIVAHSMGGLVARYYLRHGAQPLSSEGELPELTWEGAELVERAILVGTPNGGSASSLRELTRGAEFVPFFSAYRPAILGTMPAIYQLLPRTRHGGFRDEDGETVDLLDPAVWERYRWGLADPAEAEVLEWLLPHIPSAEERRRIALDHLAKVLRQAARFHETMDRPAMPPAKLELQLVAGDAEPTFHGATIDASDGSLVDLRYLPGDHVVTRASALLDERGDGSWTPRLRTPISWARVLFLFSDHLGLTRDPAFTDNLLYTLLEAPRPPAMASSEVDTR